MRTHNIFTRRKTEVCRVDILDKPPSFSFTLSVFDFLRLLFWGQVEVADDIRLDGIDLFCLFLEVCPFLVEPLLLL